MPRIGVVTIQGGGAVAIDLIGQLQGLVGPATDAEGKPTDDADVTPAAIAGTSAGAIIATLYWLGYEPAEIVGIVKRVFAPGGIDRFFGGRSRLPLLGFRAFARMVDLLRAFPRPRFWRLLLWPGRDRWYLLLVWPVLQVLTSVCGPVVTGLAILFRRGIFPGIGFAQEIDALVRGSRLVEEFRDKLPKAGYVTFGQIAALANPDRLMPLFLIATDVTGADLTAICSFAPACAHIEIALAVRASASFPIFFRPVSFGSGAGDSCFIDGGVVSNFPSWVFAQGYRRSLRESGNVALANAAFLPWVHYGLRLPEPARPRNPQHTGAYLRGLANLLTGRARARLEDKLSKTVIRRRDVTPSDSAGDGPSGVLDFSALSDPDRVQKSFERGRQDGRRVVLPTDFTLPPQAMLVPILQTLHRQAAYLLGPFLLPEGNVRVNVFLRQGDHLVLYCHFNMQETDTDRTMVLRFNQGITGLAFTTRQVALANLRDGLATDGSNGTPLRDPFLAGAGAPAVRQDRTWLMSMPILDMTEAEPLGPEAAQSPLALGFVGPTFGVLNVDAAVDYAKPCAPAPDPVAAAKQDVVLSICDSMKSASLSISRVFDHLFLEGADGRSTPGSGTPAAGS